MRPKNIYVAASRGSNLLPLLDALTKSGYAPVFSGDGADIGESVLTSTTKAITRSDLVLLVLTEQNSTGAAFEAGIAAASGIPILIAATPKAKLAANLSGLPTVSFKLAEPIRIVEALNVLSLEPSPLAPTAQDTALGKRAEAFSTAAGSALPLERERALAAAIEATGAIVVVAEGARDDGFDIAVWSNDLAGSITTPILIELKDRWTRNATRQLQHAVRSQPPGALALLVYREGRDMQSAPIYDPQILAIQEGSLFRELETQSFAQIVSKLRNAAMHATEAY